MESRNSHYQTRQATQARLKANFPPIKILRRFLTLREREFVVNRAPIICLV